MDISGGVLNLCYLCCVMKRLAATLLALIYFTVSSGMVMNMHYCMGKLSSVKLAVLPDAKCACGKKTAKKSCCRTEVKLVKVEDAQQKAVIADVSFELPVVAPVTELNFLHASFYRDEASVASPAHAPPLLSEQDTYLQNCVFRI